MTRTHYPWGIAYPRILGKCILQGFYSHTTVADRVQRKHYRAIIRYTTTFLRILMCTAVGIVWLGMPQRLLTDGKALTFRWRIVHRQQTRGVVNFGLGKE